MKRLVLWSPAVVFLLLLVASAVLPGDVEPVLLAALALLQVGVLVVGVLWWGRDVIG